MIVNLEEIKELAKVNEKFGSADLSKKVLDAISLIEMIAKNLAYSKYVGDEKVCKNKRKMPK